MLLSTLLESLSTTVPAMYREWSISQPTTSCCHTGHPVCSSNPPPPETSHIASAGLSDERTHAPVHLVMHRHKDQERSRLRASFNAALLWEEIGCTGGWFTESTQRGLGFFLPLFSACSPPSPQHHHFSPCAAFSVWGALVPEYF